MTTKTIKTNKYGIIDIRRTSQKIPVYFPFFGMGRNYTRVAWEDTNACYWVKVDGHWYKTYYRPDAGYSADGATIGFEA